MVYMYLVRYADTSAASRELALLSINSFQKDLAASNQVKRSIKSAHRCGCTTTTCATPTYMHICSQE